MLGFIENRAESATKALACGIFTASYWTNGFFNPNILTTKVTVTFLATYTVSSSFFNICLYTVGFDKLNNKNIYLCADIASALISTYVALKFTTISYVFNELLFSAALSTFLTKVVSRILQTDNANENVQRAMPQPANNPLPHYEYPADVLQN